MTSITTTSKIRELQVGDTVLHHNGDDAYTVLEVTLDESDERIARVRWSDGGHENRAWHGPHLDQEVTVKRESDDAA